MTNSPLLEDLYDRLISINREAFDANHFDVAFHALASALHCAKDLKSTERLFSVARIAKVQLELIDQHYPEYQHSTKSASRRRHENIFYTLSRQAETIAKMNNYNRGGINKKD